MVVPPSSSNSDSIIGSIPAPIAAVNHNNMTTTNDHTDAFHHCTSLMAQGLVEQLGWMFYYVKPNSSIFMNVDDVPNYEVQVSVSMLYSIFTMIEIQFNFQLNLV